MERENQYLQRKLNDLVLIAKTISIDRNFILGYIYQHSSNGLSELQVSESIWVSEYVVDAYQSEILSKENFLQLIVILGHVFPQKINSRLNSLYQFSDQAIKQIISDQNYLKNKYFLQNQPIQTKNMQLKLQEPQKDTMQQRFMQQIERKKSSIGECPVCLVEIQHQNICVLGCGHIIHQQCFLACMKESILNKKFPLKCPFEECPIHIGTDDVQEYLPKELIEKYYEFTLHNFVQKNTKNMSWCPTPGCSNAFQFDLDIKEFNCQKCNKKYCLTCKTQTHVGMTCEQNQLSKNVSEEDKQFMQFARGAKYKQCPECRFWVQKSKGCCHMTCRCTYEFCYVCGVKYGDCNCEQSYQNYYGSQQDDSMSQIDSQGLVESYEMQFGEKDSIQVEENAEQEIYQ